eukprot:1234375-Amphidinium_carterae.1
MLDRFVEGVEVGSVACHYATFAHIQGPKDALRIFAAAWASALPTQPRLVICNNTMRFAIRRQLMYPSKGQGSPCQPWKHRLDAAGLVTPHRCNQPLDAFSHHAQ